MIEIVLLTTLLGACDHCPDPASIECFINYAECAQCWEDCGQPLTTPTPEPTFTPVPTPTPTPTPTPFVYPPGVPMCPLSVRGACGDIYMIAVYAHEDPNFPGLRYTFRTLPQTICPGETANPIFEGYPIGFEWWWMLPEFKRPQQLVKSCGDTRRTFGDMIFQDDFESGDLENWKD